MAHNKATDRSSYFIDLSFFDEEGVPTTPVKAVWTLTDKNRVLINNRLEVDIPSVGETAVVVLSGDDLRASDGDSRVFTIEADYDSLVETGLPLKSELRFTVEDLIAIPVENIIP